MIHPGKCILQPGSTLRCILGEWSCGGQPPQLKHADAKDLAAHDPKWQLVVMPWILSNAAVNQRQWQLGDWEQPRLGE